MTTTLLPTAVGGPAGGTGSTRPSPRRSLRSLLTVGALLTGALLVLAATLTCESVRVSGVSMQPTLVQGDRLLVDTWSARAHDWRRGDVVVVEHELAGLGPTLLVKRVVGVGGDTVALEDGVLEVNGSPVGEAYADPAAIDSVFFGPVTVPAGSVFLMGDNRLESVDSRDFGAVPADEVEGRVLGVVWPLGRAGKDLS